MRRVALIASLLVTVVLSSFVPAGAFDFYTHRPLQNDLVSEYGIDETRSYFRNPVVYLSAVNGVLGTLNRAEELSGKFGYGDVHQAGGMVDPGWCELYCWLKFECALVGTGFDDAILSADDWSESSVDRALVMVRAFRYLDVSDSLASLMVGIDNGSYDVALKSSMAISGIRRQCSRIVLNAILNDRISVADGLQIFIEQFSVDNENALAFGYEGMVSMIHFFSSMIV